MRTLRSTARLAAAQLLPARAYAWLHARARREAFCPPPRHVRFGDLRRVVPIGRRWGKDRGGRPIDRYYIERFLTAHAHDVCGRVLEAGDDSYTRRFGGSAVTRRDVLHVPPGSPAATIVDDLACGTAIPSDAFDCVLLTQVLHVMADPAAAVRTIYRILKPGGVALVTLAGISQISRWDMERWGDYWRFTTLSAERLFTAEFPPERVQVEAHGNVLAAVAFLHGLAAEELRVDELDFRDADYQMLLTVRAVRPEDA